MHNNIMLYIFLLISAAFALYDDGISSENSKVKRSVGGALHIVTNHAEPIHADVKAENTPADTTDKPCNKSDIPSHIENGVGFKVTPPETEVYEVRSLRKSLTPSHLDLIRNISRVVTLAVLLFTAVFEFYPLMKHLFDVIFKFLYL